MNGTEVGAEVCFGGGLFRAVPDRDVRHGAYRDVFPASLKSPPPEYASANPRSKTFMNHPG